MCHRWRFRITGTESLQQSHAAAELGIMGFDIFEPNNRRLPLVDGIEMDAEVHPPMGRARKKVLEPRIGLRQGLLVEGLLKGLIERPLFGTHFPSREIVVVGHKLKRRWID